MAKAAKAPEEKVGADEVQTSPAITRHDEYKLNLESNGQKFTGATVLKVVAVRKIHPDNAASLNIHVKNSLTCYMLEGTYKVGDVIPMSVLKSIAPNSWGKED